MTLAECDEQAAELIRNYANRGEFCIVIRTIGKRGEPRLIYPQCDVTKVSAYLQAAADLLFNGPRSEDPPARH